MLKDIEPLILSSYEIIEDELLIIEGDNIYTVMNLQDILFMSCNSKTSILTIVLPTIIINISSDEKILTELIKEVYSIEIDS